MFRKINLKYFNPTHSHPKSFSKIKFFKSYNNPTIGKYLYNKYTTQEAGIDINICSFLAP